MGDSGMHPPTSQSSGPTPPVKGGRFDFDDGGTYCGGWEDGRAHGHGVCTGPKGQGEYSGSWHFGFEVSGVYTWPSGACYEGQWQNGKRHGLGVETRGRWVYKGEWTQGYKGRYGVRQSLTSNAKYEGTWVQGLQDGYGSETYADGGTYQGQWHRGMRQGYGVRASAPFGMATHLKQKDSSVPITNRPSIVSIHGDANKIPESPSGKDEARGGFVLKVRSDEPPKRRGSLSEKPVTLKPRSLIKKLRKQKSTGDIDKRTTTASMRSTASTSSWTTSDSGIPEGQDESNASFVTQDEQVDPTVTETYMGEWKNDKRSGFGVSERSDGLKYEGEWYNNKKFGYGVTTFRDGTKEEGKYKNNVLITSEKKKHLFLIRSAKFRERIEQAVSAANRAYKIALQKADIAISRTANARGKAEHAEIASMHAREDADEARKVAKQFAPDFQSPGEVLSNITRLVKDTVPILRQPGGMKELSPAPHFNQQTIRDTSPYPQMKPPQQPPYPDIQITSGSTTHLDEPQSNLLLDHRYDKQSRDRAQQEQQQRDQDRQKEMAAQQQKAAAQQIMSQNQQQQLLMQQPASQVQQNTLHSQQQKFSNQQQQMMPNQEQMMTNQQQMMANQPQMMANQPQMMANQSQMMANQSQMMANQPQMMGNQSQGLPPSTQHQQYPHQQNLLMQQQQSSRYDPQSSVGGRNYGYPQTDSMYSSGQSGPPPSAYDQYPQGMEAGSQQQPLYSDTNRRPNQFPAVQPIHVHAPFIRPYDGRTSPAGEAPIHSPSTRPPPGSHYHTPPIPAQQYNTEVAMEDHFDHYRRSNSRDRSVDRYSSGGGRSRYSSRTNLTSSSRPPIHDSMNRGRTPGSPGSRPASPRSMATPTTPHEFSPLPSSIPSLESLASSSGPKRTESLYINPVTKPKPDPSTSASGRGPRKRKKSLPDEQQLPKTPLQMTREEVALLSHHQRLTNRRQAEEAERYRANPLLYLTSPQVQDWCSRQQLVIVVFVVNVVLAGMFFKLLT
ncbi:unnamed protein product [Cyprideis torosa]|uniref:Uncharacterized protein n=1 Tax=Cyprideis torosa TaxID=163714 RepID=A0A7R8W5U6_9CRUS|nr:unnamed protein product [Cyprideis torosa]CAG0883287.1 unnamed protein product [Cyprideis torosa]